MSHLSFKSILNGVGFHRQNSFDVVFRFSYNHSKMFSKFISQGFNPLKVSQILSDSCYQVNPGVGSIETVTARTYGETFDIPVSKQYDALTMGFYMDNNGSSLRILHDWMETIYDTETRFLNFPEDYMVDIDVIFTKRANNSGNEYLYSMAGSSLASTVSNFFNKDGNGDEFLRISFEKAYPKSISAISLSGITTNSLTQFDATFAYRRAVVHKGFLKDVAGDFLTGVMK